MDLGGLYFLDQIRWLNTHNGSYHDRATTDWSLEVSQDGVVYTEIAGGTEPFSATPSWVAITDFAHDVSYRYLRLNVNGYYNRGGGINEIEACGIPDSPPSPNIALGKQAVASAFRYANVSPDHVTDGSYLENTIDYWLLPDNTPGWVRVDLGNPYFLDEIRWLNTHDGAYNDRAATDWSLKVSKDGVVYTEIASGTEEFSGSPSWVIIPCDPEISYRYIRLQVDGYYNRGGGINEIEARGTLDNPGSPNIALGKPATASATSNPNVCPDHVTDGSTLENILDYWLLPNSTTGWVQVDLEGIYDIHKIRWLNTHNDGYNDRATTDWRLEISSDGTSFTEYTSGTEEFSSEPTWVEFKHIQVDARYLRLYVDGYYNRGGGVNEIEAYGDLKNIALGKPATASATSNPNVCPDHVTDGSILEDILDYWLLPDSTPGWVQVDLGNRYELCRVDWLNTHNDGYNDRATTEWHLAVSEDGVTFEDVAAGDEEFSTDPGWVEVTAVSGLVGRYVRIYVDDYYNRGGGLNEIKVYALSEILPDNIALGKPVTASATSNPNVGPDHVTDGSCSEGSLDYWLLPDNTLGWVEVDLEDIHDLSEIRWLNTHNDGYNDRAATSWRVEISEDGIDYSEVGSGTESFSPTPSWVAIPLEEAAARYIRLHVDGYYNRGGGINELEAYEVED